MLEGSEQGARPGRETAARRPRIGIMGEFSAGKSTLTNLLMGCDALPVKVTATQLPPVWLSHGTGAPYRVDLGDAEHPVDLADPDTIPVAGTRYLRVFRPAGVLEVCDLIDFPGISDPNMASEVWQRAAGLADAVLWCSHATQAWRQSEAAVWSEMPQALKATSFLLLTRWDRLDGARDRSRVLARVRRETAGLFAATFPLSLTEAHAARDDRAAWQASGAETLTDALLDLVHEISNTIPYTRPRPGKEAGPAMAPASPVRDRDGNPEDEGSASDAVDEPSVGTPPCITSDRAPAPDALPDLAGNEGVEPGSEHGGAPPFEGVVPRRVKASGTAARGARMSRGERAAVMAAAWTRK